MQHGYAAAEIFSSLFRSAIVQSSQPKARFGKIEQGWINQCSMIGGHGRRTECKSNRPESSHDLNSIIQAGINLLYMRPKADQIFDCLINQTDDVGSWLGIADEFILAITPGGFGEGRPEHRSSCQEIRMTKRIVIEGDNKSGRLVSRPPAPCGGMQPPGCQIIFFGHYAALPPGRLKNIWGKGSRTPRAAIAGWALLVEALELLSGHPEVARASSLPRSCYHLKPSESARDQRQLPAQA